MSSWKAPGKYLESSSKIPRKILDQWNPRKGLQLGIIRKLWGNSRKVLDLENPRKHGKFPKRFYIKEFLGKKKMWEVQIKQQGINLLCVFWSILEKGSRGSQEEQTRPHGPTATESAPLHDVSQRLMEWQGLSLLTYDGGRFEGKQLHKGIFFFFNWGPAHIHQVGDRWFINWSVLIITPLSVHQPTSHPLPEIPRSPNEHNLSLFSQEKSMSKS